MTPREGVAADRPRAAPRGQQPLTGLAPEQLSVAHDNAARASCCLLAAGCWLLAAGLRMLARLFERDAQVDPAAGVLEHLLDRVPLLTVVEDHLGQR